MNEIIAFAGTVFMGFFAIMNPVANTPVFVSLTKNFENSGKIHATAFKAVLYAFLIVTVFCVGGQFIFKIFGITLPAFQITGGILLFSVGLQMIHGKPSHVQYPSTDKHKEAVQEQVENASSSIAISPLAIPILAGPGTIATAMNFVGATKSSGLDTIMHTATVVIIFALMSFITFLMFIGGERIIKLLGHGIINVISRIMGLILAVISVQMIISGINNAIKMYYQI
ncbi:MAG: MarC family protein [Bacteroidota bacterium]|nr:MarC family protein [Bacteroidota bacterium]